MRFGVNLGYWAASGAPGEQAAVTLELATTAEQLGYDVAWAAEAYGSDAPTVLAWLAGHTSRIGLGSAVMQIPARTPAMTAMTAATLDVLSGGRFRLGLGVSGPQVSEGWHGARFTSPLGRTREYIDIVRMALARERVTYHGKHYTLPLPDGPGKALQLTIEPISERVPIYLAAVGPKNLELVGEAADGWLGLFINPDGLDQQLQHVAAGCERAGRARSDVDVVAMVPVAVGEDVTRCADALRGHYALYIGGMGSKDKNFYHQLATRLGFGAEAEEVQDLYLSNRHRAAMAAVPFELIDCTALVGPPSRIGERMLAYAEASVTTLSVTVRAAADLAVVRAAAQHRGLWDS